MPSAVWNPQVERRPHPLGEMGVRSSLEEVARRAAAGGSHPRVRSWAIEQIHAARQAGRNVKGDRARAEILLQTVQRTKTWVPDPVNAEYIPGAHLLACNKDDADGVCLKGDDCDGLAVLLGACCLSVGLHAMIVGHGYNQARNIQHVLCAIRVNGTWLYADPSYDFPLGRCEPFRRERLLSIPNVKVLCDANQCIVDGGAGINPDRDGFVTEGVFIGVNGIEWLGQAQTGSNADPVYKAAYDAALPEAKAQAQSKNPNPNRVVEVAGGAAAGAACAAVGAAAASPFCAIVGAKVTGWVTGLFKSSGEWEKELARIHAENVRVIELRKQLTGETWSEQHARDYIGHLYTPCGQVRDYDAQAQCIRDKDAQMLADFSAVGAAKQAKLAAQQPQKTSSTVRKVTAVAAAGGLLWWLLA